MSTILIVSGLVLLAGALAGLGHVMLGATLRPQRAAREPNPEPVHRRLPSMRTASDRAGRTVRVLCAVPGRVWGTGRRRVLLRLAPTGCPPAGHVGATETWSPLAQLAHVEVSPELRPVLTEVEMIAEVHGELDVLMADFRHDLDHILDGICRRLDPYWTRVDADTGVWDAAALRDQLDAEDMAGAA